MRPLEHLRAQNKEPVFLALSKRKRLLHRKKEKRLQQHFVVSKLLTLVERTINTCIISLLSRQSGGGFTKEDWLSSSQVICTVWSSVGQLFQKSDRHLSFSHLIPRDFLIGRLTEVNVLFQC